MTDISAILSGDRGDVTAEELAELVRLANSAVRHPHWVTVIETITTGIFPSDVRVAAFHSKAEAEGDILEFINEEFEMEAEDLEGVEDDEDWPELPLTDAEEAMDAYTDRWSKFCFIEELGI